MSEFKNLYNVGDHVRLIDAGPDADLFYCSGVVTVAPNQLAKLYKIETANLLAFYCYEDELELLDEL